MRFGLTEQTIKRVCGVLARNPHVERAVIYGSRAKGNYRNGSDIDLTLIGPELDFNDLLHLSGELDDLLLPYMIDLSIFHQITNQDVIEHINRIGIALEEPKAISACLEVCRT